MTVPEYLTMFSGHGHINVVVKFKGHDGTIRRHSMMAREIASLVSCDGAMFHRLMTFDGYLFAVQKYEIDVVRKRVVIYAVLPEQEDD